MIFDIETRPSDSLFVERVWRSRIDRTGLFISTASTHSELVVWKHQGKTTVTLRGPETKATFDQVRVTGGEFFGVTFKLGVFMPHLLPKNLLNRRDVNLPEATSDRFWLQGSAWEIPMFENADTFVNRLIHDLLLIHDELVTSVLQNELPTMSIQHLRRRYLRATGLTPGTIRQIERAKQAIHLLEQGIPILDVVFETGYFDQPHLTRSLKRFFGRTPAQIARIESPELPISQPE